ncbi:hypothetical protein HDU96_007013 [Phlyctochytrium bullatum]|nr:hypothetical protein HDU96_007013 [Phlyctochytrium bullatum]
MTVAITAPAPSLDSAETTPVQKAKVQVHPRHLVIASSLVARPQVPSSANLPLLARLTQTPPSSSTSTTPSSVPQEGTRFHHRWLRHNCPCLLGCRHPTTRERIIDSIDVPLDVHPSSATWTLRDGEEGLEVVWDDGHNSFYTQAWLKDNAYDWPWDGEAFLSKDFDPINLSFDDVTDAVALADLQIDFAALASEHGVKVDTESHTVDLADHPSLAAAYARAVRHRLDTYGATVVRTRGLDTEVIIRDFLGAAAEVIPTHFGRIEDLRTRNTSNANTDQLGYTNAAVEAHTDQPFLTSPPGMQLLQCVQAAGRGGESLVVCADRVTAWLGRALPEVVGWVGGVEVGFDRKQRGFAARVDRKILEVNEDGGLVQVRYSYFTHAAFGMVPFGAMEGWYAAYDAFSKLVRGSSPWRVEFALGRGDLVIYNNWRMLHGRKAFVEMEGGEERHLRGVYFHREDVTKRLEELVSGAGDAGEGVVKRRVGGDLEGSETSPNTKKARIDS